MEIQKIEFPEYLNNHTLTEQELAQARSDGERALAKDWNVMTRKMNWLMERHVELHNLMVDHDRALDTWKRVYWLIGLLGAGFVTVLTVIKMLGFL